MIMIGGKMKVDYNDVVSVLALFDKDDIPYIQSKVYLKFFPEANRENEIDKSSVKVKKRGEVYDRPRK